MKKISVTAALGILIGFVLGVLLIDLFNVPIDATRGYGVLEAVYYIVSPIATLITLLAVIVALFGNEIRMWVFREKCDVSIDKNGFVEDIYDNGGVEPIEACQYDCRLLIENIGGGSIENCGLFLKSISYRENKDAKPKKLKVLNQRALYWTKPEEVRIDMLSREKRLKPIIRIKPETTSQTPDAMEESVIPTHLSIIGYNLEEKHNKKGIWEIGYSLATNHKVLQDFTVVVSWTGIWKQRETEMSEEVTVELRKTK